MVRHGFLSKLPYETCSSWVTCCEPVTDGGWMVTNSGWRIIRAVRGILNAKKEGCIYVPQGRPVTLHSLHQIY